MTPELFQQMMSDPDVIAAMQNPQTLEKLKQVLAGKVLMQEIFKLCRSLQDQSTQE